MRRYDPADLLELSGDYSPYSYARYTVGVEAAVLSLLAQRVPADTLLTLTGSCTCIANMIIGPTFKATSKWQYASFMGIKGRYGIFPETRKILWLCDPAMVLDGWDLGGIDPGDFTALSKDLLWLMLVCRSITGRIWRIPYGCEIGIVRGFLAGEVDLLEDPAMFLPLPVLGEPRPTILKRPSHMHVVSDLYLQKEVIYDWELIAAVVSSDSWWPLYESYLAGPKVGGAKDLWLEFSKYFYQGSHIFDYLFMTVPRSKETRILEVLRNSLSLDTLAYVGALYSSGPYLACALALQIEQLFVTRRLVLSVLGREKIGAGTAGLLTAYFQRCDVRTFYNAISDALFFPQNPEPDPIALGGGGGLGIVLGACASFGRYHIAATCKITEDPTMAYIAIVFSKYMRIVCPGRAPKRIGVLRQGLSMALQEGAVAYRGEEVRLIAALEAWYDESTMDLRSALEKAGCVWPV